MIAEWYNLTVVPNVNESQVHILSYISFLSQAEVDFLAIFLAFGGFIFLSSGVVWGSLGVWAGTTVTGILGSNILSILSSLIFRASNSFLF